MLGSEIKVSYFSNFLKNKIRKISYNFLFQILRFHTIVCCFVLLFLETGLKYFLENFVV